MARHYADGQRVKVSQAQLDQYAAVLKEVQQAAGVPIEELFMSLDLGAAATEAVLVEAIAVQVDVYGGAMAEAVSAFLQQQLTATGNTAAAEAIRAATAESLAGAPPVDREAIAGRVSYQQRRATISPEAKQSAAATLRADTEQKVKQRGYDVIGDTIESADKALAKTGNKEKFYFAWVPQSPTPCAFCITVASNGWRRARKKLVNEHADEIHPNCSCLLMIRTEAVDIPGYDPDKYLTQYLDAAKATSVKGSHAVVNTLQRQLYADPKKYGDRLRAQHRAQYARTHPHDDED